MQSRHFLTLKSKAVLFEYNISQCFERFNFTKSLVSDMDKLSQFDGCLHTL